jgi:hypothetical protein
MAGPLGNSLTNLQGSIAAFYHRQIGCQPDFYNYHMNHILSYYPKPK